MDNLAVHTADIIADLMFESLYTRGNYVARLINFTNYGIDQEWITSDRFRTIFVTEYFKRLISNKEGNQYENFNKMKLDAKMFSPTIITAANALFNKLYKLGIKDLPILDDNNQAKFFSILYKKYVNNNLTRAEGIDEFLRSRGDWPQELTDIVIDYDTGDSHVYKKHREEAKLPEYTRELPMGDNLFGMRRPSKHSSSRYHRRRSRSK